MILAIRSMPKPVVAAVHGNAVGAGCSLALACDFVMASESASFHLAFSRVGLGMDGGASVTVAARAGFSVATSMSLFGEPMSATAAASSGLVERVVPDASLADDAVELLERLAAGPTLSYAASKRLLNESQFADLPRLLTLEAESQEALLQSADFAAALEALVARRDPEFGGR
jgi:enoyl-CoA hydratase/carnithine racemase